MTTFAPDLLRGKVAFVAGGTSGINLGIAEAFAQHGARVAVLSRKQDKVDAAVARLGTGAIGFAADVREPASVAAAFNAAADTLGPLDIVVSGAAGNFIAPAAQMSANAFKTVVDIDLLGTFNVLRAAFDVARKPGASFINISAPQSTEPYFGQAHVCAAKAGVDMLTRCLALEWGPIGVRVNAIVPGPIEGTEGMARLAGTPELAAKALKSVALGRFGTTDEVADAALWLASSAAAYVTGVVLPCDGGQVLAGGFAMHPATLLS